MTRSILRVAVGLTAAGIALFWSVRGVGAALGNAQYFAIKYGAAGGSPDRILRGAERSHAFYPWQYYLCILAAETAWHDREAPDGRERPDRVAAAQLWCRRGLALNPYKSALRLLEVRLMERESPAAAARRWESFVDWQFWEPYNHAVLAELYARAGRYEDALSELRWTKGSEYHAGALEAVLGAWAAEKSGPR